MGSHSRSVFRVSPQQSRWHKGTVMKKSEIIEKIVEVATAKDTKPTTMAFAMVNAAIKGN